MFQAVIDRAQAEGIHGPLAGGHSGQLRCVGEGDTRRAREEVGEEQGPVR